MWIYSHTNYTLKGYTRLTHEAVQFVKDGVQEVSEEVGNHLLGSYPLQFCKVDAKGAAEIHRRGCPLYDGPKQGPGLDEQADYANRRLGRPPRNRMMSTR